MVRATPSAKPRAPCRKASAPLRVPAAFVSDSPSAPPGPAAGTARPRARDHCEAAAIAPTANHSSPDSRPDRRNRSRPATGRTAPPPTSKPECGSISYNPRLLCLEYDLGREFHLPIQVRLVKYLAEIGLPEGSVRRGKHRMIQQIECRGAELQPRSLGEPEILRQRQVYIIHSR